MNKSFDMVFPGIYISEMQFGGFTAVKLNLRQIYISFIHEVSASQGSDLTNEMKKLLDTLLVLFIAAYRF